MAPTGKWMLTLAAAVFLVGATWLWPDEVLDETEPTSIVDYGSGPGRPAKLIAHRRADIPAGPATANVTGVFAAPVPWPIIPIHMALLPDGRVMSFGSSTTGQQGGSLAYDVWSPALGTGTDAHLVLPNTTQANIFCAGLAMLPSLDSLMTVGGTLRQGSYKQLYGISTVTAFDPTQNALAPGPPMLNPRFYPTMLPLPNGQVLVAGGRLAPPTDYVTTPELFDPVNGWQALTNATSTRAFGKNGNWFYPRLFLNPSGGVTELGFDGLFYAIDPSGVAPTQVIASGLGKGSFQKPEAMFAPGQILSLRGGTTAETVDLTGATPSVTATSPIDQDRAWSSMTVLADGTVLVTGGSAAANQLVGVDLTAYIWNPATGAWTPGASAAKPRLYHSAALLLTDGSVLTGGGGDPGPVRNMNAEIYYPPYLYDPTGAPALRPVIVAAPATAQIGGRLSLTVDPDSVIGRVTMLRAGASTHSMNIEQNFSDLGFSQSGQAVTVTLPSNVNLFPPGFYLVFVFTGGVPSVASVVNMTE